MKTKYGFVYQDRQPLQAGDVILKQGKVKGDEWILEQALGWWKWKSASVPDAVARTKEDILSLVDAAYGRNSKQRAEWFVENVLCNFDKRPCFSVLARAAITMRERLIVHRVTAEAVDTIDATDIHAIPAVAPSMFQSGASVILVGEGQRLRGEICGILLCVGRDGAWQIGVHCGSGFIVGVWRPTWGAPSLDGVLSLESLSESSKAVSDFSNSELISDAVRILLTMGALLDAHGTPIAERTPVEGPKKSMFSLKKKPEWSERHVYLDPSKRESRPGVLGKVSIPGTNLVDVRVTGHLKMQPCGPRSSERKLIYVESHQARRWISPLPRRVTVH